jgi:hypothetical protein
MLLFSGYCNGTAIFRRMCQGECCRISMCWHLLLYSQNSSVLYVKPWLSCQLRMEVIHFHWSWQMSGSECIIVWYFNLRTWNMFPVKFVFLLLSLCLVLLICDTHLDTSILQQCLQATLWHFSLTSSCWVFSWKCVDNPFDLPSHHLV